MKLAKGKIARQLSNFILIQGDIEFAQQCFSSATKYPNVSAADRVSCSDKDLRAMAMASVTEAATEKFSRTDLPFKHPPSDTKCALFEAGLISYARCFNSGARTKLKRQMFTKERREIHDWMILVRNQHVSHSTLKNEKSLIGYNLVPDAQFGPRPSMVMNILAARRGAPNNRILDSLSEHCVWILEEFLHERTRKLGTAFREQVLNGEENDRDPSSSYPSKAEVIAAELDFPDFPASSDKEQE